MVKVLNVISDSNIGGAGRVLLNYLKYHDKSKFDASVCLPEGSLLVPPLKDAGAAVYELPISAAKSFDWKDVKTIKALIKKVDPISCIPRFCPADRRQKCQNPLYLPGIPSFRPAFFGPTRKASQ